MFVHALMSSAVFNPTEAARIAKYRHPKQAANKLLQDERIQSILGKAMQEREERMEVTGDRILEELDICATRDILDLCDENGHIIVDDLRKIPERLRRCIDSVKVKQAIDQDGNTFQQIELKLVPKIAALELSMKHRGMLAPKKHEVKQQFNFDWDRLAQPWRHIEEDDPIEQAINDPAKYLAERRKHLTAGADGEHVDPTGSGGDPCAERETGVLSNDNRPNNG